MRVMFAGDKTPPVDDAGAEAVLAATSEAFKKMSYGKYILTWTITPVLTLANTSDWYSTAGYNALLNDARAAAKVAGFDYLDFDLDMVRHNNVSNFAGGYGNIGQRGAWVQSPGVSVILHELGHNLGLHHANFWNTSGPDSSPKISPPFPSNVDEGREGHAFDPDSLIGHDSVIGNGSGIEYGDITDIMGTGDELDQFGAAYKRFLGWLPESLVTVVTNSGIYRIYDFTAPELTAGQPQCVRIARPSSGNAGFPYWLQFRASVSNHPLATPGLQIHWLGEDVEVPSTLLLDMTPGSTDTQLDAALPPGHTFADAQAGIYVTPLAEGGRGDAQWVDVAVSVGPFPTNHLPELQLTAAKLQLEVGEEATFAATATDADNDLLAYAWDLGNHEREANTNLVTKSWDTPGEYTVRCEVSDLKGGLASRHLVVTVGAYRTFHVSGRVLDETGRPVAGVRVHNGRQDGRNQSGSGYIWTLTDSEGRYTLTGLKPGFYTNAAFLNGYQTTRVGGYTPVELIDTNISGLDFTARRLPAITVRVEPKVVIEGQGNPEFVFTRAGSLETALSIGFSIGGTAQARSDYISFFFTRVTFQPGEAEARVSLITLGDNELESPETVVLQVDPLNQFKRQVVEDGRVTEFTVYYPGWELQPFGDQMIWAQTYPEFILTPESSATLTILDASQAPPTLGFELRSSTEGVVTIQGPAGTYTLQASEDLAGWTDVETTEITSDSVEIMVPAGNGQTHRFFRAIRP